MKVFYHPDHCRHAPTHQFSRKTADLSDHPEIPLRAQAIASHLAERPEFTLIKPPLCSRADLCTVHAPQLLDFLSDAAEQERRGTHRGTRGLIPSTFALPRRGRLPRDAVQQAGYFCTDAQTPVLPSTWTAAVAAASCALAGAAAVLDGDSPAYALCRPPGHHAGRDYYGGYCYCNNAALAATRLSSLGRTAVLDLDYHHGNGTQDLFYGASWVCFASLHADPAVAYPFFHGYAEEMGSGEGRGFTRNLPLPLGTGDAGYLDALALAVDWLHELDPQALVVSFGYDTYRDDPISRFDVSLDGYAAMAQLIRGLELPVLVVQEGGYHTGAGPLCVEGFLRGLG